MSLNDCGEGGTIFAPDTSYVVPGATLQGVTLTQDGVKVPALKVVWTEITSPYILFVDIEFHPVDNSSPITVERGNAADLGRTITNGIVAGKDVSVRIRAAGAAEGLWTSAVEVSIPADMVSSDTLAVGGTPSVDVLEDIETIFGNIDDLITIYGDTAAAAASAAAAAAAEADALSHATTATSAAGTATAASGSAVVAQGAAETAATAAASYEGLSATYAGAAATSASASSTSSAAASASATAAQSSAVLSARVSTQALDADAVFAQWAGASGTIPDKSYDWTNGTTNTKETGVFSPNAFQQVTNGSADFGIVEYPDGTNPGLAKIHPGFFVVFYEVELVAGTLQGAGMHLAAYNSAITTQGGTTNYDISFYALHGAGITGRRYSGSFLADFSGFSSTNCASLLLYIMSDWSAFSGGRSAKTIRWHKRGVRWATQSEIEGKATAATVVTQAGAIATIDDTLAERTAAWWELFVTAGTSQAAIRARADGESSAIRLVGDVLSLAESAGSDSVVDILTVASGFVKILNALFIGVSNQITLDPTVPALIFNNGVKKVVVGINFGTTANLMLWAGPSIALADMSPGNGDLVYGPFGLKGHFIEGLESYWSFDATIESDPFETDVISSLAGAITVDWGGGYLDSYYLNYPDQSWDYPDHMYPDPIDPTVLGTCSMELYLWRKKAGGSWDHVDTLTMSGDAVEARTIYVNDDSGGYMAYGSFSGDWTKSQGMSNSKVYYDPDTDTDTRQFKITINADSIYALSADPPFQSVSWPLNMHVVET